MPNLEFLPLSESTLSAAIDVAEKSFAHDQSIHRPAHWFRAGLYAEERAILEELAGEKIGAYLSYWVALLHDRVIGTTGLYSTQADYPDALWVGWFCLDNVPTVRGHGYGKQMLDFTKNKARIAGAKILKLYTSDVPEEAVAQHLYEKGGLTVVHTEPHPQIEGYKLLYRQVLLS